MSAQDNRLDEVLKQLSIQGQAIASLQESVKEINKKQPLPKEAWAEMKKLFAESSLPLYADESCVTEEDVQKCENHFHGINIKLTKCSGITPALRMVQHAKSLNLKVMIGSMNESVIGSAAAAHFLPQIYAADIDGPLLQDGENASGLQYENGRVSISNNPGLGIQVLKNKPI